MGTKDKKVKKRSALSQKKFQVSLARRSAKVMDKLKELKICSLFEFHFKGKVESPKYVANPKDVNLVQKARTRKKLFFL